MKVLKWIAIVVVAFIALLALLAMLSLIGALAPPTMMDGLRYLGGARIPAI